MTDSSEVMAALGWARMDGREEASMDEREEGKEGEASFAWMCIVNVVLAVTSSTWRLLAGRQALTVTSLD